MSDFPADSHFSQAIEAERRAHPLQVVHPSEAPRDPYDDQIKVGRTELESWYNEVNDLVRRLGVSTSTGSQQPRRDSQKRAQRASSSQGGGRASMDTTELHERLTDHRNALYRYLH
jgi:hypothetical protein